MRPLCAIAGLLLMAGMTPGPSYADGMPPATAKAAALPSCPCPPVRHVRHVRYRHHYVRHWRRPLVPLVAVVPLPPYNAPIPWAWDTAYDRAMTLHFRSHAVSGTWTGDPGLPPTPPIVPVEWYREPAAGGAVFQYDGLTGEYVRLAAFDAVRALPPAPPPPAAPPPAR